MLKSILDVHTYQTTEQKKLKYVKLYNMNAFIALFRIF